eukprot:NODE_54_length_1877_cov_273.130744_g34_i0.p1 GENE.NODE_54_length_1877_cov_273.130744_g34_i0~~NODE_54_length_1877_cov_273.130744_g34_i0.p1  ORF type:complete len:547 (-),score=128.34 NODE_54_length_1877_cov_273.130744_g34_i0:165-1805(-)
MMQEMDEYGYGKATVPGAVLTLDDRDVIETDYRLFRYSKFALPWLLFMLCCFVVLLCLTFWQGGFSIKRITEGVPRDLEPYAEEDDEAGLPKSNRNLRFTTVAIGVFAVLWIALVYYANPRPKTLKLLMLIGAVLLFVTFVLAIIAFCIDVGKVGRAVRCYTQSPSNRKRACESRETYATVVAALDMVVAILALVCLIMVVLFSKAGTFRPGRPAWMDQARDAMNDPTLAESYEVNPVTPGKPTVHKTLAFLGLFCLLLALILLLIFSLFLHENRERVTGKEWDPISGQTKSGWPRENTRLRLAASTIAALLCLLSFVPYPNRVYAYLLAFGFFCACIMFFVAFALDVQDLDKSTDLACPSTVQQCLFHPYNATAFFDFFCGFILVIYLAYEFAAKHKRSTVPSTRRDYDFEEGAPFVPVDYPTAAKPYDKMSAGPMMHSGARPWLGVEVVEVEHPTTRELNVTVLSVTPGGAAEEAGIRVGDIVSRWDEMPITCKADFAQAVSTSQIGSTVVLQVIRQSHAGAGQSSTTTTSVEYCTLTIRGVQA